MPDGDPAPRASLQVSRLFEGTEEVEVPLAEELSKLGDREVALGIGHPRIARWPRAEDGDSGGQPDSVLEDLADRIQLEPVVVQLGDLMEPVQVPFVVMQRPPLTPRLLQQTRGPVVADGAHGQSRGFRQFRGGVARHVRKVTAQVTVSDISDSPRPDCQSTVNLTVDAVSPD